MQLAEQAPKAKKSSKKKSASTSAVPKAALLEDVQGAVVSKRSRREAQEIKLAQSELSTRNGQPEHDAGDDSSDDDGDSGASNPFAALESEEAKDMDPETSVRRSSQRKSKEQKLAEDVTVGGRRSRRLLKGLDSG